MNPNLRPVVIALGMFDGVHIGHMALLRAAIELSNRYDSVPIAYTYCEHPQALFGNAPCALTTQQEKDDLIKELGIETHFVKFDRVFANMYPDEFIAMLEREYDLRGIVAGFNYHFGKGAAGNSNTLQKLGNIEHFEVGIIDPVLYLYESVSSTRIRNALKLGDMQLANGMLGRPYFFKGEIVAHNQIGSRIGFPTANILPGNKLVPPNGVYAARATVEANTYAAAVNIGVRPTVCQSEEIIIEAHILRDCGDLYGKVLKLELLSFLRPEKKFDSMEELKQQIAADCESVKKTVNSPSLKAKLNSTN